MDVGHLLEKKNVHISKLHFYVGILFGIPNTYPYLSIFMLYKMVNLKISESEYVQKKFYVKNCRKTGIGAAVANMMT